MSILSKLEKDQQEAIRQANMQFSCTIHDTIQSGYPPLDEHARNIYPRPYESRPTIPYPFGNKGESILFTKEIESKLRVVNPINQLDRLFALVYDALVLYNTDKELNLYWSFDTEYLHRLLSSGTYDQGEYVNDSVYVYRNINKEIVMSTPLVKFVVDSNNLTIVGLSVDRTIIKNDITKGVIPILRFIRDVTKDEVIKFDCNHDSLDEFNEPAVEPKRRTKK